MGFFHQLRLLLWKNLTLKKRSPFVLMFEVSIPLVLFIILLLIRRKLPANPVGTNRYAVKPLPSAGVISFMQMFCEGGARDRHGFPTGAASQTTTKLLNQLQTVAVNHNFFNPGFTPSEMDDIPEVYRSVIEDPAFLHEQFANATDLSLKDLLSSEAQLEEFLIYNLSIPRVDAIVLENVTIHIKELYRFLFGEDWQDAVDRVASGRHKRSAETQDLWSLAQKLVPTPPSVLDSQWLQKLVVHSLRRLGLTMQDFGLGLSEDMASQLQKALMQQVLGNPLLLSNQSLLETVLQLGELSRKMNIPITLSPEQLAHLIKIVLLSPTSLQDIACDSKVFSHLLIPTPSVNKSNLLDLQHRLCQLNMSQDMELSDFLRKAVPDAVIVKVLHLKPVNLTATASRVQSFVTKMKKFVQFQEELEELARLVAMLPLDALHPDNSSISPSPLPPNTTLTTAIPSNETKTTPKPTPPPKRHRSGYNTGLLKIWSFMQMAVCGKKIPVVSSDSESEEDSPQRMTLDLDSIHLSSHQERMLGIILHVLYSNPKILYSPVNSSADHVMQKANATFAFVDLISVYARKWLNISAEIRQYLDQPHTKTNLKLIRTMQKDLQEHQGFLGALFRMQPLSRFLNDTVPSVEEYEGRLGLIDHAARAWLSMLQGISLNVFQGFPNEEDMLDYFLHKAYHDNVSVIAGVVFERMEPDGSLPPHVRYKIRQNATFTPSTKFSRKQTWYPGPGTGDYPYYQFGFVWVQDMIERAIIDVQVERDVVEPGTFAQQFPYPCYMYDQFMFMIEHVMPLCLTISWVYTVAMLVQNIVYEKEQRLKEVMKMMGLSNAVHWCAWFLTSFCQMTITVGVLTAMLKYGRVLPHSNLWIIFLVLQTYSIAVVSFSFLISVLYSKAKVAAACAGIIYFLSYVPYMYIAIKEDIAGDRIPAFFKSMASLFSTTAFGLGAKYFAFYEEMGVGVQWDNIYLSPVEDDEYNLFMVTLMMILDSFLYAILVWYIEHIHPGSYGLPKPWYFPFTRNYWCGGSIRSGEECSCSNPLKMCIGASSSYLSIMEDAQACALSHTEDPDHARKFEPVPGHLMCGVHIENLTKVYKQGKKKAVKNLTLDLYEGQITSFLGHNGAGKTTTMSMLTGLIPITSGSATIYGMDIRTDMDVIRQSLGMCPQHNVLFDKLTVEEHLWLYARLKGIKPQDTKEETDRIIEDLGLPDKRRSPVDCLSGGMQRKLSVAIAFVGGSRTVILDEPTAGVDPYARRAIWDLLVKYKAGRTILLSTHHMDEADILGDRIAIISNGQLKCCGSPIFLKNNIGMGYHLKMAKAQDVDPDNLEEEEEEVSETSGRKFHSRCQPSEVTAFIQRHVPSSFLSVETLRELHYILPFQEAKKGNFEKLFSALETDLSSINISSYGVMDTTLEEVFLKVTETGAQEDQALKEEEKELEMLNAESGTAPVNNSSLGQEDDNNSADFDLYSSDRSPLLGSSENASMNALGGAYGPLNDELELDNIGGAAGGGDAPSPFPDSQWSPLHINEDPAKSLEGLKGVGVLGSRMRLVSHFRAVIIKRFHYITRNWRSLFSQIILPAIFVAIAMTVALAAPSVDDLPQMELSPTQYFNLTQPRGNFIPFTDERMYRPSVGNVEDAGPRLLMDTLRMPSGIGATCVLLSPFNSSFDSDWLSQLNYTSSTFELLSRYFQPECRSVFVPGIHYQPYIPDPAIEPPDDRNSSFLPEDPGYSDKHYYPQCHCADNKAGYICSSQPYPKPPSFHVVTRDILQNITGQLVDDFLLFTTYGYRQHRYGALSFGLQQHYIPPTFGKDAPTLYRKLAVRNIAKVWFNHKGFHSMAVYLNSINNAILRANLPKSKGNPAAYGITAINHPWNDTNNKLSTMDYIMEGSDVLIAMFIIAAMSFVPASFVVFLIMERSTKAKHLQFVSGINPVIYWIGNYVWDMCNYVIPALMCILILVIFQIPAYVSTSNLPGVVALFLMYGWSITPVMYPASFMFNEPSTAYICLIVINLFTGITCIVSSFLLEIFSYDKDLNRVNNIVKFVFMMFPNYCLGRGLMDVAFNEYKNEYYFKTGQYDMMRSPMEWDLVPHYLVAMAVIGLVFFLITLLCEYRFFIKPRHRCMPKIPLGDEDEDVAAERRRSLKSLGRNDVLFLENLTKVYVTRKLGRHLAVDRLCLGVPPGECFGLLGVNGAGKTTLFKMLTGELCPTAGSAYLNGHSVVRDLKKVQSLIGYCPQFDALFDELTAREHLQLYCRLRGIPPRDEKQVVEWSLAKLGLKAYADKLAGTFSGGCKRKLSTAIALLGEPAVIFMDEPTTGMDPHSRRFLWDLILGQIAVGRSVVLTSHSMEECEALCTRLAIMVNGRFRCLGSAQHLKSRYGQGYTFSLRLQGPDLERNSHLVRRHLERKLPEAVLKEHHVNILQYELPSISVSLALLFSCLEECIGDLPIEDYSVSQNTLDNVFINFVKQQMEIVRDDSLDTTCNAPVRSEENDEPLLVDNITDSNLYDSDDDCLLHFDQPDGTRLSLLPLAASESHASVM